MEGKFACNERVHHDAQAPEVTLLIIKLLLENLRRNIERAANCAISKLVAFWLFESKAKVNDLDYRFLSQTEHNVLWLNVTVDHSILVQVGKSLEDGVHNTQGHILSKEHLVMHEVIDLHTRSKL